MLWGVGGRGEGGARGHLIMMLNIWRLQKCFQSLGAF